MKEYYVMGSCHIDLAWLAQSEQYQLLLEQMTILLLDMLEHDPELRYVIEQAHHYRRLAQRRPDLIQRMKHLIETGQIEAVGGLASTTDTNLPCPESLVRNLLRGLNWFEKELGVRVETGWLIDTFGLSAQLPQLLRSCGIETLLANRLGGVRSHDVFYSEGLDGSRVLLAGRDAFSPNLPDDAHSRVFQDMVLRAKDAVGLSAAAAACTLDGPILVNIYLENETFPHASMFEAFRGLPGAKPALPREFFRAVKNSGLSFPVISGDLNPEFSGTYAQRTELRLHNRRTEALLLDTEAWAVLLRSETAASIQALLQNAWWDLAFVHFHDVFSGSHPDSVYQDAQMRLSAADACAAGILSQIFGAPEDGGSNEAAELTVVNSLPFPRRDWVVFPTDKPETCSIWVEGKRVSSYTAEGKLCFAAELPAMGSRVYTLMRGEGGSTAVSTETTVLENCYLKLVVDPIEGVSLLHKPTGTLVLDRAKDLLVLQPDKGTFQYEELTGGEQYAWARGVQVTMHKQTEERQVLSAEGRFGDSACWQLDFVILDDDPALYLAVNVDWRAQAQRLRLKLATQFTDTGDGFFEIPFGTVRRKAYADGINRKGEWPVQRYCAVENAGAGLALINRGTAGAEIVSGTIWTTLLRAPVTVQWGMTPDGTSSQHGIHNFEFALLPYAGERQSAGIIQAAQRFNHPPLVFVAKPGTSAPGTQLSVDCAHIELTTVKFCESDAPGMLVLRLYETSGKPVSCVLTFPQAKCARLATLREEPLAELPCVNGRISLDFRPWEIQTLLIER